VSLFLLIYAANAATKKRIALRVLLKANRGRAKPAMKKYEVLRMHGLNAATKKRCSASSASQSVGHGFSVTLYNSSFYSESTALRYLSGVIPVSSLNTRLKLRRQSNPDSKEISTIFISVRSNSSLA